MGIVKKGLYLAARVSSGHKRLLATVSPSPSLDSVPHVMRAWRLHSYTGVNSAKLDASAPVPTIQCPYDVLVKVKAASVNPLDIEMARGYGSQAFKAYRALSQMVTSNDDCELPLTLGRDFSGVVVDTGMSCGDLSVGDEVWGTVFPSNSCGSHADYVLATALTSVGLKPKSLSHVEAASVPYAALTAWSGLEVSGNLLNRSSGGREATVLVIGASGGVGTLAVQILKSYGARVVATCQDDAFELVTDLGADVVLNYKSDEFEGQLTKLAGKFDAVLDCSGNNYTKYEKCLKPWSGSKYITFTSPLLQNTDRQGVIQGALGSAFQLATDNMTSATKGGVTQRWAYFMPNPSALNQLAKLADNGSLRPVIHKVVKMSNLDDAYNMQSGGLHQ